MDTRRCAFCHKLQRADAHNCSRCGQSLPSVSSHRVGHYAGLHPEDQPYHSNVMTTRKARGERLLQTQRESLEPPEHIIFPDTAEAKALKAQQNKEFIHALQTQRDQQHSVTRFWSIAPYMGRKPWLTQRTISIALTVSCIVFLLLASIIAFLKMSSHPSVATPVLKAAPDLLRAGDLFTVTGNGFTTHAPMTFVHENKPIVSDVAQPLSARTDAQGAFSIIMRVPDDWQPGTHTVVAVDGIQSVKASTNITILAPSNALPLLELSQTLFDFGTASSGTIASQHLILRNTGGGQVLWQATSDYSWLTVSPSSGSFAGSQRVQIAVNRASLQAGTYTGTVSFTQQGSTTPLTLKVRMVVLAGATNDTSLALSETNLVYAASLGQDPVTQTVTLRNEGKQELTWKAAALYSEQAPWLYTAPGSGKLAPGKSQTLPVVVRTQGLAAGSYQGKLIFTSGSQTRQVIVSLTVSAPPISTQTSMDVLPASLDFETLRGTNPSGKNITITNTGDVALPWNVSANTSTIEVSPAQGTLAPGQVVSLMVNPQVANANPGTLSAQLTVSGSNGTLLQKITVKVVIKSPPVTLTSDDSFLFQSDMDDLEPTSQLFIRNDGTDTVRWQLAQPTNAAPWFSYNFTQGQLAPKQSTLVQLRCDATGLSTGTYSTKLLLRNGENGEIIKTIPITLVVE